MSYDDYPKYVSVAEKKAKAEKKRQQLLQKRPDLRPVILAGSALARTWWGKSWNQNLERYADYSNRIDRGRGYVRHGAVLDLQIAAGQVKALVQGSRANPYEVEIAIKPIAPAVWKGIQKRCAGQLGSLQDLMVGKFPKELAEVFLIQGQGLFPTPKEISFTCSCPDWASMCKHVAATLYGIGARLDEDPTLFFQLRGVRSEELVAEAVKETTGGMLAKAKQQSAKVIADADLSALFGIDLERPAGFGPKTPPQADANQGTVKGAKAKAVAKAVAPAIVAAPALAPLALVATVIAKHQGGVDVAQLAAETGIPRAKLYGLVHRLKQQGTIKSKAHGVYIKS